jgi:hypothetical protein
VFQVKYIVEKPNLNQGMAALWSSKRLPFEPKGWEKEMRDELKSAIKQLGYRSGDI